MRRFGKRLASGPKTMGRLIIGVAAFMFVSPAPAQSNNTTSGFPVKVAADATAESLFRDFLHYAKIGRFDMADTYAQALLEHSELNAIEVMTLANEDRASLETLIILIRVSSIGDNAAKVLKLIYKGENLKRQDKGRIRDNIRKLGGPPQQFLYARDNLIASGEYAVPHLIRALLDSEQAKLWPRIISATPWIGKPAVNPLVAALSMERNDVRLHVIKALGEIGYPQAIPYLLALIADSSSPEQTRQAASTAIARIETITGRVFPGTADDHFVRLAEKHYEEYDDVRADTRLDTANVWYWDEANQELTSVAVPRRIFGAVMGMRCAQRAIAIQSDRADAIALWLAANIRRESRLGMNVESSDPGETGEMDPSRPENFPRALYFTQAAGARYAHLVLERAVRDNDSVVALGAIGALRVTAGEASLIGTEDYKQPLVQALRFPDALVRIRAALALGAALPKTAFADSQDVIPTLAAAVTLSGDEQIIVVDPDEANLNRVAEAIRAGGRQVIREASFYRAMERARREFEHVTMIVLASDLIEPPLGQALAELRGEFTYGMTPVLILAKPRQDLRVSEAVRSDGFAVSVAAAADEVALTQALERAMQRSGGAPLDRKLAMSLALESVDTLRRIAVDGRTVFRFGGAESALVDALSSENEELQTKAASVLALARTSGAQRAVAALAIDSSHADSLRIAAFGSLAESAKNNGNWLADDQVAALVEIAAEEADLTIRTAASQALGALNLASNKASEIIRSFRKG